MVKWVLLSAHLLAPQTPQCPVQFWCLTGPWDVQDIQKLSNATWCRCHPLATALIFSMDDGKHVVCEAFRYKMVWFHRVFTLRTQDSWCSWDKVLQFETRMGPRRRFQTAAMDGPRKGLLVAKSRINFRSRYNPKTWVRPAKGSSCHHSYTPKHSNIWKSCGTYLNSILVFSDQDFVMIVEHPSAISFCALWPTTYFKGWQYRTISIVNIV